MGYTFVLIHGSWHDGRAWAPVVKRLEQAGHKAHAPTVAGHGVGANKGVSHADCVQSVLDYVKAHDLKDFVLLGHSFGGTIIQPVAEKIPDRIRRLIFQNAFVLNDGESLVDNVAPHFDELFESLKQPDGGVPFPYAIFRDALINDADEATAKAAFAMMSSTPRRSQIDKVPLKTFFSLEIPKSFLNCTDDNALGAGGWHPGMSQRLGFFRLVQMPGSHETMFSNPDLLAEKIVHAGRD